jgi:hypothetical protein
MTMQCLVIVYYSTIGAANFASFALLFCHLFLTYIYTYTCIPAYIHKISQIIYIEARKEIIE